MASLSLPSRPRISLLPCPWPRAVGPCPSDPVAGLVTGPTKPGPPAQADSLAWPWSVPVRREVPGLGLPRCPRLPCSLAGMWGGPRLPGPDLPNAMGDPPAPAAQGAAGPRGTMTLFLKLGFQYYLWRLFPIEQSVSMLTEDRFKPDQSAIAAPICRLVDCPGIGVAFSLCGGNTRLHAPSDSCRGILNWHSCYINILFNFIPFLMEFAINFCVEMISSD